MHKVDLQDNLIGKRELKASIQWDKASTTRLMQTLSEYTKDSNGSRTMAVGAEHTSRWKYEDHAHHMSRPKRDAVMLSTLCTWIVLIATGLKRSCGKLSAREIQNPPHA